MAKIRGASTTAYAVALVLFVILFVFSLVSAILFYTKISQADQRVADADKKLREVATDAQLASLRTTLGDRSGSSGTLLVGLQQELAALRGLVAGSETATVDSIRKEMATAEVTAPSLMGEIRRLNAEWKASKDAASEAEAGKKSAEDQLAVVQNQKAAAQQEFDAALADLKSRLDQVDSRNTAFQATVSDQGKTLADEMARVRSQTQGTINSLRSQIDQKDKEIESLNKRIRELQQRSKAQAAIDPSVEPKGIVAAILSERGLVYINRGRSHRIQLGMTFLVGDRITGLSKDENNELQGKAVVEVINVMDESSVARIVKATRGNSVIEGDPVFNAAYDPNVHYKFVVFGEFDIDNTGSPSVSDRQRIETLITQSGGSVVQAMTYDTDFLVLAPEPKIPEPLPADVIDQTRLIEHAEQTRRYNQWQELLAQAKALSIPVLNQNRFLSLVGYYQR